MVYSFPKNPTFKARHHSGTTLDYWFECVRIQNSQAPLRSTQMGDRMIICHSKYLPLLPQNLQSTKPTNQTPRNHKAENPPQKKLEARKPKKPGNQETIKPKKEPGNQKQKNKNPAPPAWKSDRARGPVFHRQQTTRKPQNRKTQNANPLVSHRRQRLQSTWMDEM